MSKSELRQSSIITEADRRRRIYAFAVTGLAVFVLTCLIWPLSVTGFRSVATVNVNCGEMTGADDQLKNLFSRLIQEETSDERLEAIISEIDSTGILHSKQFEFRDHEGIRNALKIGMSEIKSGCRFHLALDGAGGEDERELVNQLAIRVAHGINRETAVGDSQFMDATREPAAPSAVMATQAAQMKSFDEANWILEQIEHDLNTVKASIASAVEANPGTAAGDLAGKESSGSFQFASSRKVIAISDDVLLNTVNSIDTGSLRVVLGEIENRMVRPKTLLAQGENINNIDNAELIVQGLERSRSAPLNGAPGWSSLLMLAMFSGVIGLVVARRYQPFETSGFDTVETLGKLLGIPVIVQIKSGNPSSNEVETEISAHSWPNRIVKLAGLALFGIATVVVGFVLINSDVRAAFMDNPLYGCAEIIRIFAGY